MRDTSQKDRGILTFQKELINQRGEAVQIGKTVILLARRPSAKTVSKL